MSRSSIRLFGALGASVLWFTVTNPVSAQVTFEWATVGNPGNAPDPLNPDRIPDVHHAGSVGYVYRMAKHEVTNSQYAAFLNAVAATDDNALYNSLMGTNDRGGITRLGSPGKYAYEVKPNMGDKPVNFVSFLDAMRFVNWLQNNQPTGAQGPSTTESGAYFVADGKEEEREPGATYFLPSVNEWYKAAYHQPAAEGGDVDDYWLYPTASNDAPTSATATAIGDVSNPGANVANYNGGADWNGLDSNVTTVGSCGPASASYYGTFDQAGNVFEWVELMRCCPDRCREGPCGISPRAIRGGASVTGPVELTSSQQIGLSAPFEHQTIGFRVASRVTDSADFDLDVDVDLRDFQHFQNQLSGPK